MSLKDAIAGPCAEVVVGSPSNAMTFHIHKKLLCNSSTYFNAALSNGFAETTSQKITLDDEDPTIFHIYAQWLYESKITRASLQRERRTKRLVYFISTSSPTNVVSRT